MKVSEFNKSLKQCSTGKRLDPKRVKALPEETKREAIYLIVRKRHAILYEFIPQDMDYSWLNAMGYLYTTVSKTTGFMFLRTVEQVIQ